MNLINQVGTTAAYDPSMFFMFLVIAFVFFAISSGLTVRIIKNHVAAQQEEYAQLKAFDDSAIYQPANLTPKQLTIPMVLSALGSILLVTAFIL